MTASTETAPKRSSRAAKIVAVVAVLALLAVAQRLGIFHQFGDPAAVKQTLVQLGPWGYAAFVLAYAALQPFGMPGTVFIMAAPLIWPWPIAFALSMTGTMAASVVGFSFARFVARDWIATKIPARFRRFDEALARRAFSTVFLLRLVFWMPPFLHAFFGVSKVRFWTHFWGSLAGYVLPLFLVSFFGPKLFDMMKAAPASAWIALGAIALVLVLAVWIFRRYGGAHLAALAFMQSRILASYLWVFFRTKVLRWRLSPAALTLVHRRNARRFRDTASHLKGANVKLGQMASMQAHLLPKEVIEELKSLRDAVTATPYPLVADVVRSELGHDPHEVFAEFDEVPIASASMAQVHLAKLKTGEKVAVKVLHPGLERSVEIDLRLMRFLVTVLGWFYGGFDLKQILAENEEPLRRELDLQAEGKATERIAAEMVPLGVIVPKVYWDYTSRRVITLEFIDGVNVDDHERLTEWKIDRRALADSLARAMLHQTYGIGFFHADPHPGNLFCTPEGKLAMLDFGMVKQLPEHVRLGLMKEIFGAFFNIPQMYADGLIEKGLIGEADRGRVETFAIEKLGDPKIRAMLFDHKIDDQREATAAIGSIAEMIVGLDTFKTPQDNMMFMRALGITIDVCKEIAPDVPMSEIMGPLMMPLLAGLMEKHPSYTEAVMKAMATMTLPT